MKFTTVYLENNKIEFFNSSFGKPVIESPKNGVFGIIFIVFFAIIIIFGAVDKMMS